MVAILEKLQRPEPPAANDGAIFEQETNYSKLAMFGRTMIYLVKALNRLEKCPASDVLHDRVVYHVVSIFRTLVDRIQSLGLTSSFAMEVKRARSLDETVVRHSEATCPMFDPNDICAHLSHLFISMLVAMESRKQAHAEITEGAMCCLLKRAGVVLKNFVIDVAYRSWNQDDFSSSEALNEELLGMQSEAPYLIWILERAMTVVQGWKTEIDPHYYASSRTNPGSLSSVLAQLQNTLLRAVFQDDTATFEDCFREPSLPLAENGSWPSGMDEGGIIDWYKKEIWRIVGWQELRKHIVFEEDLDQNCP